jgi:hypothetical protein
MLRFAILQNTDLEGSEKTVCEHDSNEILSSLKKEFETLLTSNKKSLYKGFKDEVLLGFLETSFANTVTKFKQLSKRVK